MKIKILFIIFSLASFSQGFIDTVYSFTPGEGQSAGQSSLYFPENIFGAPSIYAERNIAEIRPEEILSLGLGGEIILGVRNGFISNGEGDDFTIFENAFEINFNKKMYAEPAIVSVSLDSVEWFTFDFDLDSLTGLAGTNYTIGNNPNSEYGFSGGNSFDLGELGLEKIKYIKLKDTTEYILNNLEHNNYDPTLSGFDLDAAFFKYVEITQTSIKVPTARNEIIAIYDLNGNKINKIENNGFYFIRKENGVEKIFINSY